MTHQEIREEMKNLQGDPAVIARRRAIQRQMALNRIGDKVPKADVVVTNPTELAVAIQYDPQTMAAPIVLAKGAGVLAQRIRRLALENNIPVVERKPLAHHQAIAYGKHPALVIRRSVRIAVGKLGREVDSRTQPESNTACARDRS